MIPLLPQTRVARLERFRIKHDATSWLSKKTLRREIWRLSMRERRTSALSRTSMVRRFKSIMQDASVRDWKNLALFSNLRQSVYVYDHDSKSVRNPGQEIEWPIVWLLSAFHRKHIFVPQRVPETKHINDDAIRLTRRVEWAWALRKDSTCLPSIHIKSREIASCSKLIPPIIKCWTTGLRRAILNAAKKGCSEAINCRFTNESLLLRWARQRLRASQWTAVQSDKDGGFVMCAKHDIPEIHAKLLTKDMYDERNRHEYDTQSVMQCCLKLAQKIAKHEDEPGLTHAIMKPWWNKNCSLTSKLRITCKSHKPAGEVSFRNVHASVGYPLAGVAQWVVKKLRRKLGMCNHLLKNSKQFVESLQGLTVHGGNY